MAREFPRIQVHDFSGHPFQADLSRELARRGFHIDHAFSNKYKSGKGRLELAAGDPDTLTFTPIRVKAEFEKYSALGRIRFERAYARAWKRQLKAAKPDLIIACNVPLLALNSFRSWVTRKNRPWILWHQDIFSSAMGDELDRRIGGPIARLGRAYFTFGESRTVSKASRVIAIGEEFRKQYAEWGIDPASIEIIPNWAPIDEITMVDRKNDWALDHLPSGNGLRLLYAGMLGRKHNPKLLVDLLDGMHEIAREVDLVVVSEGEGADDIQQFAAERPDAAITILPFQDIDDLPQVFGSSDVLVAILEPEASKFSIPSKVLSYMAAGRPILGLMPDDNPAADDIRATGGFVATPDAAGVRDSVKWLCGLMDDPELIATIGMQSRRLAEDNFGIGPITDQFVAVIESALAQKNSRSASL
ncbi:MAG: glycosyltransferase family 4 protein [Aeromicrobium sp.]